MLKRIEAIISPFKLPHVREALVELGIQGMTVSEVRGCGRHKGPIEKQHGLEHLVEFVPKVKIEIVLPQSILDQVVNVIMTAARTGEVGDGLIFIGSVSDAIRIRSSQRGETAL